MFFFLSSFFWVSLQVFWQESDVKYLERDIRVCKHGKGKGGSEGHGKRRRPGHLVWSLLARCVRLLRGCIFAVSLSDPGSIFSFPVKCFISIGEYPDCAPCFVVVAYLTCRVPFDGLSYPWDRRVNCVSMENRTSDLEYVSRMTFQCPFSTYIFKNKVKVSPS